MQMPTDITNIHVILLAAMVLAALWTVMTARLLRAAIGLAITSAIVSILMFQLASPLAAVFELSVCAGLISAIFLSVISLTQRVTAEDLVGRQKEKLSRFWLLPLILLATGVILISFHFALNIKFPAPPGENDVKKILWNLRHLDLIGQIVILLAGAFGVVTLFKEWKNE
jgi:NADH-quinone oxidoreductase subunit J